MASNFWEFLWLIIWGFFLISYLMVLFRVIGDIFLDRGLGGFSKAIWIIALLLVPMLTALIYIIARGGGMARRQNEIVEREHHEAEEYIRRVAGQSPSSEIANARELLKAGTISESEFAQIKAKALA